MVCIKCFNLDNGGDVEIANNKIVMTSDSELLRQKVQRLLNTNKGEWFGNPGEGIDFRNILGKNVEEETVKSEILDGLLQIDDSFIITDFKMSVDNTTRKLNVSFTATNEEGEVLEQTVTIEN